MKEAKKNRKSLDGRTIVLVASTSWFIDKFLRGTILALLHNGAEVICIAPRDETSDRLVNELGARFHPWFIDQNSANPLKEICALLGLFLLLRKIRPYFTFNYTAKANIYSGIACRLLKVRYSNNVSGLGMQISSGSALAKAMKALYGFSNKGAERIYVLNSDDMEFLEANELLGSTPVCKISGAGVDLERFAYQELAPLPLTFLMIARIQAEKGVREFVQAAGVIKRDHPDTRFVLLGPTAHTNRSAIPEEELAQWVDEGIVELPGATDDVRPWLAIAHALVLPSYREGLPRTVQEAAASGRIAIVSDVPGCREAIIDRKTGFLCEPRSAESLTAMIERVIQLPAEELAQMGRAARELAEERFSEEKIIKAYLDCLS